MDFIYYCYCTIVTFIFRLQYTVYTHTHTFFFLQHFCLVFQFKYLLKPKYIFFYYLEMNNVF